MEHKHTVATFVVLALIIVGMFVFAHLKRSELVETTVTPTLPQEAEVTPYANITRIDAKHFFIDGTHTIVGDIALPTPCDLLNWSYRIQESMPETVIIDFDIINNETTCAQVVTAQRFKVSFDASKEAEIRATIEGRSVDLNLIPGGFDESPEDFELFIKG